MTLELRKYTPEAFASYRAAINDRAEDVVTGAALLSTSLCKDDVREAVTVLLSELESRCWNDCAGVPRPNTQEEWDKEPAVNAMMIQTMKAIAAPI